MVESRLHSVVLIVCLGAFTGGCQSYEEGMRVLCDSPKNADLSQHDPAERMRRYAQWLDEHINNRDVRELLKAISGMSPEQRRAAVNEAADKANIKPCLVTETWVEEDAR